MSDMNGFNSITSDTTLIMPAGQDDERGWLWVGSSSNIRARSAGSAGSESDGGRGATGAVLF